MGRKGFLFSLTAITFALLMIFVSAEEKQTMARPDILISMTALPRSVLAER